MKQYLLHREVFLLRFIVISVFIIFVLQFPGLSLLRIPLILAHLILLFLLNFKLRKLNALDFIFTLLITYVVIQSFLLQEIISLLYFLQAIISVVLYFIFYSYCSVLLRQGVELNFHKLTKYITFFLPFFLISFQSWSLTRSAGLLGNPNITAHVFIMLTPFCLLIPHKIRYYILLLSIVLLGLIMFASRSAFMAFILGIVVYFTSLYFDRVKYKFSLYLFFLALVIYLSYDAVNIAIQVMSKYNYLFSNVDSRLLYLSYNGRDLIYDMALERLKGHELFGLGFEGAKFESEMGHILSTHNGFLELFIRIGYIGTIIFSALLILMIYNISKTKNKYFRGAALMGFVIILSLATNSSTFFVFNYLFYYIIIMHSLCEYEKKIQVIY